jgi:hypothetical protein
MDPLIERDTKNIAAATKIQIPTCIATRTTRIAVSHPFDLATVSFRASIVEPVTKHNVLTKTIVADTQVGTCGSALTMPPLAAMATATRYQV